MTTQPSATPEPYAHEWRITIKADEHAGAIDALFNCIRSFQSGAEPIGGTCPRSMGNRQTYDVVKAGREARTLETELAAARAECEYRGKNADSWRKDYDARGAELARLRAENGELESALSVRNDEVTGFLGMVSDLRAEVERLKELAELQKQAIDVSVPSIVAESLKARAERAEAELAKDKARLDWLLENAHDPYMPMVCDRATIDAAMTNSNHKTT